MKTNLLKRSVPSKTNLQENVEIHKELNPKLWNSDMTLKEDVYTKLVEIANEFIKYIEIPLNIVDIELVGSNAGYNYNNNSDIDLHIIVNSEVNYVEDDILRMLYNSKKNSFNDNYDLTIEGMQVEVYIEDVKDGNATNGRYSISKNDWVIKPEYKKYQIPDIETELLEYIIRCNQMLETDDADGILNLVNEIYMTRKIGLEEEGEMSVGNLVFKELRNLDMITKLKDHYYKLRSKQLSESKNSLSDEDKVNYYYGTVKSSMPYQIYKIDNKFYDGNGIEISKDEVDKLKFFKESKVEEASLSRLFQHTKNKDTFAVIGSQDKDTKKSRFQELKSLVGKLRDKVSNLGYNYLEGTYTYEDGEQGIEDSLIVYNIPKDDALDIANRLNQESIIWKDNNYFGFIDADGTESGTFDNKDITFDQQITNMYGSRLRSGNGLKPAFAFECKLIETDAKGSTFSKQHNSNIKEYNVCSLKLEDKNETNEQHLFWKLIDMLNEYGTVLAIDKEDVVKFIVENDFITKRIDITDKDRKNNIFAIYDVFTVGDYIGYIQYKDNKWVGKLRAENEKAHKFID